MPEVLCESENRSQDASQFTRRRRGLPNFCLSPSQPWGKLSLPTGSRACWWRVLRNWCTSLSSKSINSPGHDTGRKVTLFHSNFSLSFLPCESWGMVAAGVRGCGCLKAPRCSGTSWWGLGWQEGSGQQRWVGSVCRVFRRAVFSGVCCRNEQLGCSGSGKHWHCPLIPKGTGGEPCLPGAGSARWGRSRAAGEEGSLCFLGSFIPVLSCWCRPFFHPLGIFGELDGASWVWSSWLVLLWWEAVLFYLHLIYPPQFPVRLHLPGKL